MNSSLLEQLHDIEGLDAIHWWPLALGWWVVIGAAMVILLALSVYLIRRLAFKRSWKNDALQKLAHLEDNLSEETAKETLVYLSEYLRRIALRNYSRKECAGLTGEKWLIWLKAKDPKQFDWESEGRLLINAPYAPQNTLFPPLKIKNLIQAARSWVV